ncbi:hypothetical protein FRB97_009571 [Tulasnella sp. 331]|nr:hypothetical protein FRB97_009571 [Tulasnella sp. 331]
MPPVKKKQKTEGAAASTVTLFNFFSSTDRDAACSSKCPSAKNAISSSKKSIRPVPYLNPKASSGFDAPESARKSRKDAPPVVIVIDDSDEEATYTGIQCTNTIAGLSSHKRDLHETTWASAVPTSPRQVSSPTEIMVVASMTGDSDQIENLSNRPSVLLDAEEDFPGAQPGSMSEVPRDCTPPLPNGSSLSLNTMSSNSINRLGQPLDEDSTSNDDISSFEVDILEVPSTTSAPNLAISKPPAVSRTSLLSNQGIDFIDVDALDDDGNVWDNGDDEQQADTETPGEDEEDLCEEAAQPNRGGRCLGDMVLDEAESQSECPCCGIITEGWIQEEKAEHINKCLDSSSSNKSTTSTIHRPETRSKPLSPLSSFRNRHRTPTTSSASSHRPPNAFSLLMSSRKENEAWKAAEVDLAKHDSIIGKARRAEGRRKAPFYKVMQGMPIAVDAFRYGKIPGITAYFLTHAHSDHYTNLSSSWKAGPIYCSFTTANLVKLMLNVDAKWVKPLPFDKPTVLPNTGGVEVILLEANHCRQTVNAGDCDFPSPYVGSTKLFRYLHCGDFRASPRHVLHPSIKGKKLDLVYLDTTYLNAKYCFPPQKQVIEACATLASKLVLGDAIGSGNADSAEGSVQNWLNTAKAKNEVENEEALDRNPINPTSKPEIPVKDEWDDAEMMALNDDNDPSGVPLTKEESGEDDTPNLRLIKDEDGLDIKPSGKGKREKRPLVVIGTYSIGKERIVKAVAQIISSKIYCDLKKRKILLCQDDPELHSLLTNDPHAAQVHLLPLGSINMEKLEPYYSKYRDSFTHIIGFRPTGWMYSAPSGTDLVPNIPNLITRSQSRNFTAASLNLMRNSNSQYQLYGVPYSEHSSFFELTAFALSIDVSKIIATVNVGSAKSRGMMSKWFEKWEVERKKRLEKKEPILPYRSLDYW